MNITRSLLLLVCFLFTVSPQLVEAHRSGCHRWHTCPSDTGSYTMDYTPVATPTSVPVLPQVPSVNTPTSPADDSNWCGWRLCNPKVTWETYDDVNTFQYFWELNGGLAVFGHTKSRPYINKKGDYVQIFERNTIEFHDELSDPYTYQLGLLGEQRLLQLGRVWQNEPTSDAVKGCIYFAETKHNVCGAFKKYWTSHGIDIDGRRSVSYAESLALFGYPITEATMEPGSDGVMRMTQWFQRARFEDHGDAGVLLGLLGNEVFQ
jgi:hypothetical protein